MDRIRWRFILLTLYRLKKSVTSSFGYGQELFVNIILHSGLVSDDRNTVANRLNQWANAGGRYHVLVTELGIGCLILLPDDITDYAYVE